MARRDQALSPSEATGVEPPGSEGVCSHGGLGLGGLVVVGLEGPLVAAQLHGAVGVQEEVGEAAGEVVHEAVGEGAQRLLHLLGQLPVVVLLQMGRQTHGRRRGARGTRARPPLEEHRL